MDKITTEKLETFKEYQKELIHDTYWTIKLFYQKIIKLEHKSWKYTCDIFEDEDEKIKLGEILIELYIFGDILQITEKIFDENNIQTSYIRLNLICINDTYIFPIICFDKSFNKIFHFQKFYIGDSPSLEKGEITDDSINSILYIDGNFDKFIKN